MNFKFKYPICHLHEEPLNYICLHANCKSNRLICVLCQSERHFEGHYTRPLKMYMTQKVHKLKCLTETEIEHILSTIQQAKNEMVLSFCELREQMNKRIEELQFELESAYDEQIEVMESCGFLMNEEEIALEKLTTVEKILTISAKYQNYHDAVNNKINEYKASIESLLVPINLQQLLENVNWIHNDGILVNNNILRSGMLSPIEDKQEYKVAFLEKPLKFKNSEMKFRILKNPKNWITVGVCHRKVVQSRNFLFRYHTIGHGIYGISSNGGSWSHYRPDFNNRLCGIGFKENETVKVLYDSASNRVKFMVEGSKYHLDIDPSEKGCLNFCVVMYYKEDEIEMITE